MMENYKYNKVKHMFSLKTDFANMGEQQIPVNKVSARIFRRARSEAKGDSCYLCGKKCNSFCNSHSVPMFVLDNIKENGLLAETLQGELPLSKGPIGQNKAGVFHLICNYCDNTAFRNYEDSTAYSLPPNDTILAQIALKSCLQMISKRRIEAKLYDIMEQKFDSFLQFPDEGTSIEELDLRDYESRLQYAKETLNRGLSNRYYVCFYKLLDYVVPFATQTMICPIVDLEGNLLNNVFLLSEKPHLEYLQIAVFPLENTSVVLIFNEGSVKKYRKFRKQLQKLDEDDQLAAISYLIFSYTENVFINVSTYRALKDNPAFMEVCRKNPVAECPDFSFDPLPTAMEVFSFSHRKTIPNLLSRDFALK